MTILGLFHSAQKSFANANIENPQRNAEVLLSYLLGCSVGEIHLKEKIRLDANILDSAIGKKISGEPWAYIFNSVQFRDLELKIRKGVFIPRPETEIVVEEAKKAILKDRVVSLKKPLRSPSGHGSSERSEGESEGEHRAVISSLGKSTACFCATNPSQKKILDLGTGCGNIAISLARAFPHNKILASDISKTALKIARLNAQRHNLKNIRFLYSDLFKNIPVQRFELIASNPPYIPSVDLKTLPEEVQREPRSALDGGKKGISFFLKIIKHAPRFLKKGGYLILEIGICQDNLIKKIIAQSNLKLIKIVKDYQGIPRVAIIKKGERGEGRG